MSIDLKDLEAELTQTRRKLTDWSAARTHFAVERKDQHATFLSDQSDKLKSLKGLQAQLKVTAELTTKRLHNEEDEVKRTEERLAGAKAEVNVSEWRLGASQAQLHKRQEDFRGQVEDLDSSQQAVQQRLDALREEVEVFAERFGIRFRNGPGYLTVVMTHIDANDHDKEFCVAVAVEDTVYTVLKCEPLVPDLEELTRELNLTNNFAAFVKAVRARSVVIARAAAKS